MTLNQSNLFTHKNISSQDEIDEHGGGVSLDHIANAIGVWAIMTYEADSNVTVAKAARAFNTTPDVVRDALKDGIYTYVINENEPDAEKQLIELDARQ